MRYESENADLFVLTFKEGLLSPVAHDLKLRATSFEIEVADDLSAVEVRVDASSLRVVCAMKGGVEAPKALAPKDHADIESRMTKEVLLPQRYPEIRFSSTTVVDLGRGLRVDGTLRLCGAARPVSAEVRTEDGRHTATVRIHQPDFGIKPYSALFGTMKVKPDVTVIASVPSQPPSGSIQP